MKTARVDVAIIGSGAGGGAVAAALAPLAQTGRRVVLFEKGPRFRRQDFTGQELEMAGRLYAEGGGFLVRDKTMTLAFAEGYGGSTLVYTGTSLLPPESVIRRWQLPGITHADLCARAERFMAANGVHFLPDQELNDNNLLFAKGCQALGWEARRFPVNVRDCRGSSLCNLGCPNGAKQGTAQVQLPQAEAQGVEVVTLAAVSQIGKQELLVEVKAGSPLGHTSEWEPGDYRVEARTIVLCAGAIHSPALLLTAGFGRALPALGRYWTCHPAQILVAEHEEPIRNTIGHPKSFLFDAHLLRDRFFLESCMYFPFTTAKNLAGFGPDHASFLQAFPRLQMILALACDEALWEHRVLLDRQGKPCVDYSLTGPVVSALVKAARAAARIFFAAGALRVYAPAARPPVLHRKERLYMENRIREQDFLPGSSSVSAAHLMGGCRMGVSTTDSVTTPGGQVHGIPWLFVADASLFPTALEINPYLTIMALAERVAESVLAREKVA